ncbi:MAG: alpha/beta fold hydrolase [Candidatus Hydrogenedentes bacterium]|nr:alpha/beta fold hydrolase [Candidatus Hydrogenedentota bacterium]
MQTREVLIPGGAVTLAGTLSLPQGAGPFPTCLLVHGTGPLDRDENMPGQSLDIFNRIAEHLAGHGVAALRYDKRGCGKSTGDYYRSGHHDLVDDAIHAVDFLAMQPECDPDRIFALGHSEGTVIVPQLSAQRPSLRGMVLLCPFMERVEAILKAQARHMEEAIVGLRQPRRAIMRLLLGGGRSIPAAQQRLIARLKSSDAPCMRIAFQKVAAKSLRELMALEPEALFRAARCPMLAISGAKDLQCAPEDAQRIAAVAQVPVEAHCVPDLTHLLRRTGGKHTFFEYGKLMKGPVDAEVLALISGWIERQLQV